MADKPIIFSAPMVRALLAGRKTQTRRVLKEDAVRCLVLLGRDVLMAPTNWRLLPYAPGDRLWVREAFTTCEKHKFMIAYRADGECGAWCWDGDGKPIFIHHGHVLEASPRGQWGFARYGGRWRSPIHMPRWASRLTLTVTEVRVQRLAEMSSGDALAEGIDVTGDCGPLVTYAKLWDNLNAKRGFLWQSNPWVVALTFRTELNSDLSLQ